MSTTIGEYFANTVKHWYVFLIIGIIFLVTGIWTVLSPKDSYVALAILFSISFIVSGVMGVVFSIENKDEIPGWVWMLILNVVSVIIGIVMLLHPEISTVTLGIFVGFNILLQSSIMFAISLEMKDADISDWWILLIGSILGFILACMLILNPTFAGFTIAFWTGFSFIALGVLYIYNAMSLKGIKKDVKKAKKKVQDAATAAKEKMESAE